MSENVTVKLNSNQLDSLWAITQGASLSSVPSLALQALQFTQALRKLRHENFDLERQRWQDELARKFMAGEITNQVLADRDWYCRMNCTTHGFPRNEITELSYPKVCTEYLMITMRSQFLDPKIGSNPYILYELAEAFDLGEWAMSILQKSAEKSNEQVKEILDNDPKEVEQIPI